MSVPCAFPELADRRYDGEVLLAALEPLVDRLVMDHDNWSKMRLSIRELRVVLDGLPGDTLQERWSAFEWRVCRIGCAASGELLTIAGRSGSVF